MKTFRGCYGTTAKLVCVHRPGCAQGEGCTGESPLRRAVILVSLFRKGQGVLEVLPICKTNIG